MDLIKIGKYIAGKRKSLGMTQKQLAEKIGMSDKSVSKWERGICLPDVSVYLELCEILGISLNEFFAGEDIEIDNIEKKSEDTLIQITKDSGRKQRYLKRIIIVLLIVVGISMVTFGSIVCNKLRQPQNYIEAVDSDSIEMKTAELLSGIDGTMMFRYNSTNVSIVSTTSDYNAMPSQSTAYGSTLNNSSARFTLPNVGFTLNFDTNARRGLKRVTCGFIANATANYLDDMAAGGRNTATSYAGSLASMMSGVNSSLLNGENGYYGNANVPWNQVTGWQSGMVSTSTRTAIRS